MGAADRDYLRAPREPYDPSLDAGPARRPTWRWGWRNVVALILLICFLAGAVAVLTW